MMSNIVRYVCTAKVDKLYNFRSWRMSGKSKDMHCKSSHLNSDSNHKNIQEHMIDLKFNRSKEKRILKDKKKST